VHDDLGVAARAELVAERFQFGDQFLEVVDLAVEHDDDAAVLVVQRLLPGRDIDDRKPTVAEPHAGRDMQPSLIGTTMVLRLVHSRQYRAVDAPPRTQVDNAGYSTHDWDSRGQACARRRRRSDARPFPGAAAAWPRAARSVQRAAKFIVAR